MKNTLTDIERIKHSIDVLEEIKTLDDTLYAYSDEYMNALEDGIEALTLKLLRDHFNVNESCSAQVPEFIHMIGDWNARWKCPRCGRKFSYDVRDTDTFYCSKCGLPLKMEE